MAKDLYLVWKAGDQILWSRFMNEDWAPDQSLLPPPPQTNDPYAVTPRDQDPWDYARTALVDALIEVKGVLFLALWREGPGYCQEVLVPIQPNGDYLIPLAQTLSPLSSDKRMGVAPFGNVLYLAGKGCTFDHSLTGDDKIYWTSYDGVTWDENRVLRYVGTSNGPALASYQSSPDSAPLLFMAWRGADEDQSIWWATGSWDGYRMNWSEQHKTGDGGSTDNPALAVFGGHLYMAWVGIALDSHLYWSVFNDEAGTFEPRQAIPGPFGSTQGPSLASLDEKLFMAWKGVDPDSNIYWSSFDGSGPSYFDGARWLPPKSKQGTGTLRTPALASFGRVDSPSNGGLTDEANMWVVAILQSLEGVA